jgi:signal transduction histidine kinase
MWKLQGWLIYIIPVGVAALFLTLIYLLCVRFVEMQSQRVLDERLSERERIARELHDTLFQSIQGMLLQLELISANPSLSEDQQSRLAQIEDEMRRTMIEARKAIHSLRRDDWDDTDLTKDLEAFRSHAATSSTTSYSVHSEGRPRPLRPEVRDEVMAIAREGIINAFTHASAEWVLVSVHYFPRHFTVKVTDNGVGITEEKLQARQKEGHWGIAGMHERAARLGGLLSIGAAIPRGTRVELVLARHLAYAARSPSKSLMAGSRALGIRA